LKDLSALKSILEKTPSYKAQIKGDKLSDYDALYRRLASDTISDQGSYQYFYNLAQLFFPLRDNHLGFYQLPDYSNYKTKETIDSLVASATFMQYPSSAINLDSLKMVLSAKPPDSIEGIYYYDKFYSFGLFRSANSEFIGVILDSDVKWWRKGQIAVHLYQQMPGIYKAIYGHPLFKNFMLQSIEKFQNQALVNSYFYASYSQGIYSKQREQNDYINLPKGIPEFSFRNINSNVQYLLLQTFQVNHEIKIQSQRFYDSIKNLLKAPNLIVDLRNNHGGSEKEMKKYLQLIKKYSKNGNVYVMLNNGTVSQAELFTLALKKLAHTTTVGMITKGMLSYGSNYGTWKRLPSGRF
jgi:hypothetical protein